MTFEPLPRNSTRGLSEAYVTIHWHGDAYVRVYLYRVSALHDAKSLKQK